MIVIKKRISLAFLGEENKDDYIELKSIPLKDYSGITEQLNQIGENGNKAIDFMLDIITKYFLEGKFGGEPIKPEELDELDQQTAITIFEELTGQLSPKDEASLTTPSTMEAKPPEK